MERRSMVERFWAKVEKTDGCWLWRAALDAKGYGKFKARSYHLVSAPRLSYELAFGPIAEGMCVCHRCDTPACVNPAHLFLGTQADNVADMMRKGRHRKAPPREPSQRVTHCKRGHEFTPENTYVWGRSRKCRRCDRLGRQAHKEKQKQVA